MDTVQFSGYADFEWAVQLNRFSLKLIGLWPVETITSCERLSYNLRPFVFIIAMTYFCTSPSLHLLIKVWGDITMMINNMLFTLPLLMISTKLIILWWKKEAMSSLVAMITHDWIKLKSSNERDVMIHHAKYARIIIVCNYSIIIFTLIITIIITAFGYGVNYATDITYASKSIPLQGYYMYDTSVSPHLEITFIAQSITLTVIALSYTGVDNFLGLLVFHICGQLENLTNRLHRMRDSKNFLDSLKINIMDHIRLIRYVEIIEDIFTLMLLLAFFLFGTLFCVYGFLVVTVIFEDENVSFKQATFLILTICTSFTHMCIYCAVGELLVAKYEEVYNAIYECEWYTLETREAKNLILVMVRMNKPLYITAGKIFPVTMSTFCNILKTSGGYISVLLANRN